MPRNPATGREFYVEQGQSCQEGPCLNIWDIKPAESPVFGGTKSPGDGGHVSVGFGAIGRENTKCNWS